ncbi:SRPBCC domain-containing protein [Stackebrandtia soli]|uniref:SRPBCC domain-containing protein n=1 Tax=Stackebrandtia soli TaxID=1892856 RepID=UPI0039ED31BA
MTGLTRDAGWEIGVSKTLPYPVERVWTFLLSDNGIELWLGAGAKLGTKPGSRYTTEDGTTGEVRSFHDDDRVRLTWRSANATHDTIVQVTVTDPGDGRCVLGFHQERMADTAERSRQRLHWQAAMSRVVEALADR